MKEIKIFEQVIKSEKPVDLRKVGINSTMYWAYRSSKEVGNDLINFHDVIWDADVAEIAAICEEEGIEEFTISSHFCSLIETLVLFEAHGFVVAGLTKVKAGYIDWRTNDYAVEPALKMIRHK